MIAPRTIARGLGLCALAGCAAGGGADGVDSTVTWIPATADTAAPDADLEAIQAAEVGALSFSHERGFYEDPFELTLAITGGPGSIRYTLDGGDPGGSDALTYDGPIAIETTAVVRAALVLGDLAVERDVRTYLFAADIPDQAAPDDWPTEWWDYYKGGPWPADYTMDPDVYGDAEYADLFPDLFASLPIASLSLDADDLFGEEGIHAFPEERGDDWERAASIELFSADGAVASVGVGCGVRIQGGAGRRPDRTPKKSFRVLFKSDYGPGMLETPIYEDSPVERFNTILFRAGYNRTWGHYNDAQRARAQYVRERFGLDTHRAMGGRSGYARPVHFFLNGLYWGIYLAEERPDAAWHAEHVGGEREEWDVLNSGEATDGDRAAWEEMTALAAEDLSDPDNYAALAEMLDMSDFADYMLLNLAQGNVDWPEKNWYSARRRVDGEQWRFLIWDFELVQSNTDDNFLEDIAFEDTPGAIFQALRASDEFRALFAERAQLHLSEGGALSAEANVARWEALTAEVVPAVVGESARWGDHWRDTRGDPEGELYTYTEHWLDEYDRMVNTYFPSRNEHVISDLTAAGLYP